MSVQTVPECNSVFFVWFNQYSGILLKTPSKTLAVDPVDVKAKNLQNVDAILLTHEHYDHLDPRLVEEIQRETSCQIIADQTSAKKLQITLPKEKIREAQPGMEFKIGKVTVKAEKANHPAKTPVTYIITSEDNVKVYHTADSLPFPELAMLGQKELFDIVFCTVGIAPGASAQTGFEIARLAKPHLAVPYHTATAASQNEFAELIKNGPRKIACLVPEQNKIYQISKMEEN